LNLICRFDEAVDNGFVAKVHSIESSGGNYRLVRPWKREALVMNFHSTNL
jgi:hypothetical protein